jgi:hypothetical protein
MRTGSPSKSQAALRQSPINIESGSPDPLFSSLSVTEEVEQELFIESAATRAQTLDRCPLSAEEELRSPLWTRTDDGGQKPDAQASGVLVEGSLNSLVCLEESGHGELHAERLEKGPDVRLESGLQEGKGSRALRINLPTDEKGSRNVHNASRQDVSAASHEHNTDKSKVNVKDRSRKTRIVNLDHES